MSRRIDTSSRPRGVAPDGPGEQARAEARIGLYVHVPFCAVRCRYCDFSSGSLSAASLARYLKRLRREGSNGFVEVIDQLLQGTPMPRVPQDGKGRYYPPAGLSIRRLLRSAQSYSSPPMAKRSSRNCGFTPSSVCESG